MNLNEKAIDTFIYLSECEYHVGIISFADLAERRDILAWLTDELKTNIDPRYSPNNDDSNDEKIRIDEFDKAESPQIKSSESTAEDKPPILEFLPLGLKNRWCFTLGDKDNYPSVPHGHLNDKDRPWPKLNPYNGRVFKAKDREDVRHRLVRREMVCLWNNKKFREEALKQIEFYQKTFPHHRFPVPSNRTHKLPWWSIRK